MNLVIADCEEFRRVKRKAKAAQGATSAGAVIESEEKRMLGLVILRGAHVVSCSVDGPPPADPAARLGTSAPGGGISTLQAGAGVSRPAGRGAGIGLQGPAPGIGGPAFPGAGFPGGPPPGFGGRGGPPRESRTFSVYVTTTDKFIAGFVPGGFPPGGPVPSFGPPGFQPPPGGRGFQPPPGGYPGR